MKEGICWPRDPCSFLLLVVCEGRFLIFLYIYWKPLILLRVRFLLIWDSFWIIFFFLWESKRSCRHFFSSQKVGGFFFYLILCHACDWIIQDLNKLVSIQGMTTLSYLFIRCKPVKTVHWVVLCLIWIWDSIRVSRLWFNPVLPSFT